LKFTIWKIQNGFLLNVTQRKVTKSYIYTFKERMVMLAHIDKVLGEEPEDAVGMKPEG
jgi:hypothetical protein